MIFAEVNKPMCDNYLETVRCQTVKYHVSDIRNFLGEKSLFG